MDNRRMRKGRSFSAFAKAAFAIIAWLVIWQLVALAVANPWLLSGPVETLVAWGNLALTADFWQAVGRSLARIALGFVIAFVAGCVLGYLAARLPGVRTFLKPAVLAIKSAPVVCIIALLLVAVGSNVTTTIVVGLVVFPQFYHAVMEASLERRDGIDEMLDVFGVPCVRRILCVEFVAFGASIRSALAVAAGLAWKSGVAAEIIGLPGLSIGEGVYLAKISLDSATIIAWTATVILLSWLTEKLLLGLADAGSELPKRRLAAHARRAVDGHDTISTQGSMPSSRGFDIVGLERTYDAGELRLRYEDLHVPAGGRICVMAPSGTGKTTLLRMLAGIDGPDAGSIAYGDAGMPPASAVFQDCTLVGWTSAFENIALVANDDAEIRHGARICRALLDEEDLAKPASALSGGMRRRAELARALAHPSSLVILDEPFAGLDAATKERCVRVINDELVGRTLVIATHDEEDAMALGCDVVKI